MSGPISPIHRICCSALLSAACLTGCKSDYHTAPPSAQPIDPALLPPEGRPQGPPAGTSGETSAESSSGGTAVVPVIRDWWTGFEDARLNRLIERAFAGNFTLKSTWDRLAQARAVLRVVGAERSVQLDGDVGVDQFWQEINGQDSNRTSLSFGLAAGYEADLWGRIHNSIQAAELDTAGSRLAIDTAAISLSALVADAYFRHRANQAQLRLIDSQLATNENVLQLLRKRFATGASAAQDVLRQRQLIKATETERIDVVAAGRLIESELAVLLGLTRLDADTRADLNASAAEPLVPPYLLKQVAVVPSRRVFARPDLREQYLLIEAADARIAAAMADRYPRLSLSAAVSFEDEGVRDLFDNWAATLAANLVGPLIDGGRRQAEVERTQAVLSELVNGYGQAVLSAIAEVNDALTLEQRQLDRLASIDEQLVLSKQALDAIGNAYRNGATSYLDVLDALSGDQALERLRLTQQQLAISARITLHRTVAGSLTITRPPPAVLSVKPTRTSPNAAN